VGSDFVNDGGLSRTDLMASNPQEIKPGTGFDETAELPHPQGHSEARRGRSVARMAIPLPSSNSASLPLFTKGSGMQHFLPPSVEGQGPLSLRRDSGLGRMY